MFECIGTLAVAGTTGATWGLKQLYLSTPTALLVAFIAAPESTAGALMELDEPAGPKECTVQVGCTHWVCLCGYVGNSAGPKECSVQV